MTPRNVVGGAAVAAGLLVIEPTMVFVGLVMIFFPIRQRA